MNYLQTDNDFFGTTGHNVQIFYGFGLIEDKTYTSREHLMQTFDYYYNVFKNFYLLEDKESRYNRKCFDNYEKYQWVYKYYYSIMHSFHNDSNLWNRFGRFEPLSFVQYESRK